MANLHNTEPERPEKMAFRTAFNQLTRTLHDLDDLSQMVVGNSINMANRFFFQAHTSVDAFMRLPKHQQAAYVRTLRAAETELRDGDPETALGFGLFIIWIDTLMSGDEELIKRLAHELAYFGKKGDLTRYFQ